MHAEHELKIAEPRETTNDLNNLMRTADVAIIFSTPSAASACPRRQRRPSSRCARWTWAGPERPGAAAGRPQLFADLARGCRPVARPDWLRWPPGRTHAAAPRLRLPRWRRPADGLVLTAHLDITTQLELKARAFELQRKSQLDAIIASVPNLLWTCDSTGAQTSLSPQVVVHRVELSGQLAQGWLEHVHPGRPRRNRGALADAVTHRAPSAPATACAGPMAPTAGLTCALPQRATNPAA